MTPDNFNQPCSNRYSINPGQAHLATGQFEYMLVVQTGKELGKLILDTRSGFEEAYHLSCREREQPYIRLASFIAKEEMETTIEKWIRRICAAQSSFPVVLNNFSGFPTGKLFVRVQHHEPFRKFAAALSVIDDYIKSYGCPSAKIVSHPHITIAKKLPGDLYTKAMLDYAQRDFSGSFMVQEIVLLKRKKENGEFRKINLFSLLPEILTLSNAV